MKPRLLDVFCGAGGCSMGYYRAGFDVQMGVDKNPMQNYPFEFTQYDAIGYLEKHGHEYDFIHASPSCQAYSAASAVSKSKGKVYATFLPQTRAILQSLCVPYIIENVVGAPLITPITLCGTMFGLNTLRHRVFELSFEFAPKSMPICWHEKKVVKQGYAPSENEYHCITGHFSDIEAAKKAMGIDWMNRDQLAQAIPPAYTQFLGAYWLEKNGLEYQYPEIKSPKQLSMFGD